MDQVKVDRPPHPITIKIAKGWDSLTKQCKKWQPWLTLALGGFFVGNVAARIWTPAQKFFTDAATFGWAGAIASASAAIAALTVARRAQEQSERERRNDREYSESQRKNDREHAEALREADLQRLRQERETEMTEAAQRRKEAAGIQLAVFVGSVFRAKSALTGIERFLAEPPTSKTQEEVRGRMNSMINIFDAIPIETAYEFDPNLGAHLSYIRDWLYAMELSSRGWTDESRHYVQLAVKGVKHGMANVQIFARRIQITYRDQHLSQEERDGYNPDKS
ncbi:hypothetical protein JE034_09625 [Achromobacter xylosoxidans]|uniref:hypothetical protein n=1 Tax=Alcaligenes xylosoxydans xylosoxydans TaxID=85698 RepID=UPI00190619A4|nr:hypothetical protein [Achromobacter xylosoxidans]MBK1979116.1 hypothetical protein [Achromobacter xylosoxidans]